MDRPLELARSMQHRDVFGIAPALHAEGAAEVFGDDAQFLGLDVHGACDLRPHAGKALRRTTQRELLGARVVARRGGARLKRSHHQTLVHQFDLHDMGGVLEGAVQRGQLLAVRVGRRGPVKTDIARRVGPELRRARLESIAHVCHRIECIVIDDNLLGGILCDGRAGSDHHRHRLANMHDAIAGQCRAMRRHRLLTPTARNRVRMRDRMIMRGFEVSSGENCGHALHRFRRRRVDANDPGEGMRRAHEIGRQRAVRLDVIAIAALPAQQRVILDAAGPVGKIGGASNGRLGHGDSYSLRSVMPALA